MAVPASPDGRRPWVIVDGDGPFRASMTGLLRRDGLDAHAAGTPDAQRAVHEDGGLVLVISPPAGWRPFAPDELGRAIEARRHGIRVLQVDGAGGGPAQGPAVLRWLRAEPRAAGLVVALGLVSQDPAARATWLHASQGPGPFAGAFEDARAAVRWALAVEPRVAVAPGPPAPPPVAHERPRVMVVDDERPIRLLLRRFLEGLGVEVVEADGATAAQAAFTAQPVDAAVIDKNMPHSSGMDLLRWIRSRSPGLPVVIITAQPTAETQLEAGDLGAVAYLVKPFALGALESALSNALTGAMHLAADKAPRRMQLVIEMLRDLNQRLERGQAK